MPKREHHDFQTVASTTITAISSKDNKVVNPL